MKNGYGVCTRGIQNIHILANIHPNTVSYFLPHRSYSVPIHVANSIPVTFSTNTILAITGAASSFVKFM